MARTGFYVMAALSLLIAAMQLRFFFMPLTAASPDMLHHAAEVHWAFWLHVIGASAALALGVAQFAARLRARRTDVHRWTGRSYAAAVLIGAPAGLVLALNANGGAVTHSGFALLALAWAAATYVGVWHARNGRYAIHRQWMIRSYALALAAVSLRLQVPIWVNLLGTDYTGVLPIIAWASWVPNIILAEWIVRRTQASIIHSEWDTA